MAEQPEATAAETYSLFKQQTGKHVTLSHTKQEMKAMIKQKEIIIHELSRSVEKRRGEMKKLSKQINAILDSQVKKHHKEGPSNWSSQLVTVKLKKLHAELETAYKKNQEIKNEISEARQDQPQQVVKEMEKHRAQTAILEKQEKKITNNKHLLMEELEMNKARLEDLRQNSCLIDLQQREAEYEEIKREAYQVQKDIRILSADYLQINNFYYEMKGIVEKEVVEEKVEPIIDEKQFLKLVSEVNILANERRQLEKDTDHQRRDYLKHVSELEKNIKERQMMIRQIQNDILRVGIDSKRVVSYPTQPRKTAFLPKKQSKRFNPETKPQKKTRLINNVYMMQKEQEKTIVVGDWNSEGVITSDRGQNWQHTVQRIRKLTFLMLKDELVGVRSLYMDKHRNSLDGRTLLPEGIHSYSQIEVSLDEVATIETSMRNNPIYIKFITHNGTVKEIGNKDQVQHLQRMSLEHYYIKWIEVQQNDSLVALRMTLEDTPIEDRTIAQQTPEKGITTQRSFSNGSLGPKKVILKGRSLTKLRDGAIVDHRLMLSKNKMV